MRLALAAIALVIALPAGAAEQYQCMNHGKPYALSFDRDAGTLTINREKAQIEHTDIASGVVVIRGTVDLGNVFFWADLSNVPSVIWMKDQKVLRTDACKFIDKPPT